MTNLANSKEGKRKIREARSSRFVVMLTDCEDQAIQDYRFAHRIGTKAEAARRLIASGLQAALSHRGETAKERMQNK